MHISRLFIYPIKSCAPVELKKLEFDKFGPKGDRRFMLVNPSGKFLTQRQLPEMARITPTLLWDENDQLTGLQLAAPGQPDIEISLDHIDHTTIEVSVWKDSLVADDCGDEVARWLSEFLQKECRLVVLPEDSQRQVNLKRAEAGRYVGFADGYPLLVVTQASLDMISTRVGRDVAVERFRPNVVVAGSEPLAERQWQKLELAQGHLALVKPCERCVIPTRDINTLEREADVLDVLKADFRIDNKIIFGQNAIEYGVSELSVGESIRAV